MSKEQATPDLVGDRGSMGGFAQRVVRRVQRAQQGFSPWVQRWLVPEGQVGGAAAQRRTALTTERTSALVNRAQVNIGHTAVQRSSAVVVRPLAVAQRAGAVIRRFEGSAPKYEYRSGGYGVSMGAEFTLAKPTVQASAQEGEEATSTWSGSEFSVTESNLGFAPVQPKQLATFDSRGDPSLIERLQRRLSDAKVQQTGGQVAKKPAPRLASKKVSSSDGNTAASMQGKVRPISRVEEVAPNASSKGPAVSQVDMKRVRVGEPRPAGVQRAAASEAPMEEDGEIALKPLVQRAAAPEEEEVLQAKPLVQRAAASEEEEALQAKPLVQRAAAPEEEEVLQAKPLVQRAAASEEEEVLQAKPLVRRVAAPEEEEALQAKPLVQRAAASEEEEVLQAKPLVQRAAASEEEEVLQAKPLVQRAAASEEEEVLQAKPLVRRAAASEEEEVLQAKPLQVPLSSRTLLKPLQRASYPEWRQAPMPLVSSHVGEGPSGVVAQKQAVDSSQTVGHLSSLPLVRQRVAREAGEIQRAEIPSATTASSSGTQVDDSSDASKIDLDDLARTIYSHVRRLFAVERERRSSIR